MAIFPSLSTQDVLSKTYKILITRSIVNFLPAFKFLRKNVCWHIPHPFTKEMSEKSKVVSSYCSILVISCFSTNNKKNYINLNQMSKCET